MFKYVCKELGCGAVLRRVVTQITTDTTEAAGGTLLYKTTSVGAKHYFVNLRHSMALDGAGMNIILEQAVRTTSIYKWKAHIVKIVGTRMTSY